MDPGDGLAPGARVDSAIKRQTAERPFLNLLCPLFLSPFSESNYGQVLARRRGEVFLATMTGDRSRDGTLRSVERSLKWLRTDRVDLLQIHGVSDRDDPAACRKPDGVVAGLRLSRPNRRSRSAAR
jgi:Aldo/keto reductase family